MFSAKAICEAGETGENGETGKTKYLLPRPPISPDITSRGAKRQALYPNATDTSPLAVGEILGDKSGQRFPLFLERGGGPVF